MENQDCNSSLDLAPPTSFVDWAEPENEHVTSLPKDQENNNLESTSEPVEIKGGLDNNQETLASETENGAQENHNNRGLKLGLGIIKGLKLEFVENVFLLQTELEE